MIGQSQSLDKLNIDRIVTVGKCFKDDFWAEEVKVHLLYDLVVNPGEFKRYMEEQRINNRYEILGIRL